MRLHVYVTHSLASGKYLGRAVALLVCLQVDFAVGATDQICDIPLDPETPHTYHFDFAIQMQPTFGDAFHRQEETLIELHTACWRRADYCRKEARDVERR